MRRYAGSISGAGLVSGAEHESDQGDGGGHERPDGRRAGPAPVRPFDQSEGQQPQRRREQHRSAQVGHSPLTRGAALDQMAPGHHHRQDAQRQVHQERPSPVRHLHDRAADRRPQARRDGRRRTP